MDRNQVVPPKIVEHDDDTFKRICNYLGDIGEIERPNKVTYLELEIDMRRGVVVTDVWERENPRNES